ncbi:MAG: hypothetical protein HYY23_06655 [Verrucomicrobia bacterium]|nr:hypothetical protein [Verrucomicrobiota bacterium]
MRCAPPLCSWFFRGRQYSSYSQMQIDPISSHYSPIAYNALDWLLEYAELAERRILFHVNYLRDLGEGVKQMEVERAKNDGLFHKFRREP